MRILVAPAMALIAALVSPSSSAANAARGHVLLLETCPGDKVDYAPRDEMAPLLAAIVTPLVTGMVSHGLKAWGTKLSEDAKEANFDVIHRGSHLYRYDPDDKRFELGFHCLIVASKGVVAAKGGLDKAIAGYLAWKTPPGGVDTRPGWFEASADLKKDLETVGFDGDSPPAVVGVFDVQRSAQGTEVRLVPRFVSMHHSVREKRADRKERTITFDALFEHPTADKPFGDPSVKIDGLVPGTPFVPKVAPGSDPFVSSGWFALPLPAQAVIARLDANTEVGAAKATSLETARLALDASIALGETGLGAYVGLPVPCPMGDLAKDAWVKRRTALAVENAKDPQDKPLLARLGTAELYFKSCLDYYEHTDRLSAIALTEGAMAGPFDVTFTLKEFRERPFAKFFGAVLSDEAVSGGVASAIAGEIDPAKAEAKEKERIALREAYETAVVAAENAIAAHAGALPADQLAKYIDMQAKKRAANRKARELSLPIPYPDAGFWF